MGNMSILYLPLPYLHIECSTSSNFAFVVAPQPSLVGSEQPDDPDPGLTADDRELNYGERSEQNHRLHDTSSVFNDNHVMISPAAAAAGQVRF